MLSKIKRPFSFFVSFPFFRFVCSWGFRLPSSLIPQDLGYSRIVRGGRSRPPTCVDRPRAPRYRTAGDVPPFPRLPVPQEEELYASLREPGDVPFRATVCVPHKQRHAPLVVKPPIRDYYGIANRLRSSSIPTPASYFLEPTPHGGLHASTQGV